MASDKAQPLPSGPRPNWDLPQITGVATHSMRSAPRQPRNFKALDTPPASAVEIVVTLAAPLPIRAAAPVLLVGETKLTESEALDAEGRQIRFWSAGPAKLEPGAPIALTWSNEPAPLARTDFKFKSPE